MGFFDLFKPQTPTVQSILPQVAVNEIMGGRLPILNTDKVFLKSGEKCHYIDKAIYEKKIVQKRISAGIPVTALRTCSKAPVSTRAAGAPM